MFIATIALFAGAFAVSPPRPAAESHDVRIDHHAGSLDAQYRGRMIVTHRQIGAVAPGGRPSSLRCTWQADVVVDRTARHAAGSTMSRSIRRARALTGSRPGWCAGVQAAIGRDVAARTETLRDHVLAVAAEDRATLLAEADTHHARATGG